MDVQRIQGVYNWLIGYTQQYNWMNIPVTSIGIRNTKNELIRISQDVAKEEPYLSNEIFNLKDDLFIGIGTLNQVVVGRLGEALQILMQRSGTTNSNCNYWSYIHPEIIRVSKGLFEDGHYANAAEDAFIEINDRVKKLFVKINPNAKIPDGDTAMKMVFSANSPMIQFCDHTTETGFNIQKGFMEMLAGAMSALRNPKAHANITIGPGDAMRQLMFASMLMYKIDEGVAYSRIVE